MAEKKGTRIRVTAVRDESAVHGPRVGDYLTWGVDLCPPRDHNGWTWFQSGDGADFIYGICGWIKYEIVREASEEYKAGDRVRLVAFDEIYSEPIGCGIEYPRLGAYGRVRAPQDDDGDIEVQWDYDYFYHKPSSLAHAQEAAATAASPAVADEAYKQLAQLITLHAALGPRARTLLIAIAERLVKGAREHGDFADAASRNWDQEAVEEDLDGCVYRTLGALARAGKLPL